MKAIFFGSIGSIVETSEIQRDAFNDAFKELGLDWHWDQNTYRQLLRTSGGQKRISDYANSRGETVDAARIHVLKTELFQERLWNTGFTFRPGVVEVLKLASQQSVKTGLITGTEKQTVDLLTTALTKQVGAELDIVTSRADGCAEKPSPELYLYALKTQHFDPSLVIAIEDNQSGIDAAIAAGLTTIAFAGINTPEIKGASFDAVNGCGLQPITQKCLSG